MDIIFISFVAFFTAILTFFSGFGLGTILAPAFALFFPIDVAIALTGLVHFTNNIFKISIIGRSIDKQVFIRFGIPAIVASFAGAWVLIHISNLPPVYQYQFLDKVFTIEIVKLTVAVILIFFAAMEIIPSRRGFQFEKDKLLIGGLLSGFFGGLTGIQGAIRSAFLIKSGLTKEAYIATGVAIACVIDITRLSVYANRFSNVGIEENLKVILFATGAAIVGSFIGRKLLKKITLKYIQIIVAIMLIFIALALGIGAI